MKIKKILAAIAASAVAISAMAVSVNATNWGNASYADGNPDTVKILSMDEGKVSFTATADATAVKCRVTVGDLLSAENIEKVKSAKWTVTYTIPEGTPAGNGVGGATWFAFKNSTDYWISPDYDEDGNAYWANTTYSADCEVKFLLPTEVLTADSELVFMDWSNHEAMSKMTITVSDFVFYDADGGEVEQLPYVAPAASGDTASAGTTTTSDAPATGNVPVAAVASVMAVAGVAVVASRKRK